MLGLAAALLVFTGLWHVFEPLMSARNADTRRLVPFGLAYLILGVLIALGTGGMAPVWIALVLTLIGISGAYITKNRAEVPKWVTWTFILIDAVIILALLAAIFG